MDPVISVVILGAVIAGFVQGLTGFAFSLVAVSIWAWGVEPALASTMAVFGALTGQILAALSVRRGFDLRLLAPFLVGGLVGIPIGIALLPSLDASLFKAGLGLLLILWCPPMLFAERLPRIPIGGPLADGVAGLSGGILGGIAGVSGAIPTLWCTLRQLDRDRQRSVIQTFNLIILAITASTLFVSGRVTPQAVSMLAIVIPAVIIPVLLGARVYVGLSPVAFRRVVLTCLTFSGIALLTASVPVLLTRVA